MALSSLTKNLNKIVEEGIRKMEYGFSQTLNAKQTRRYATPGHPYSKHFKIRILLCYYRMMPTLS